MEKPMEHECPHCQKRAEEEASNDDMGLAILLMLMPAMTLTLFSNIGLL